MTSRVMLIDSEEASQKALLDLFVHQGLDVHGYANASAALAAVHTERWHVVVYNSHATDDAFVHVLRQIQLAFPSTIRIVLASRQGSSFLAEKQGALENPENNPLAELAHWLIPTPTSAETLVHYVMAACQQNQLLTTIHRLKNVVKNDHPALITDINWIIRLANQHFCEMLSVDEGQLFGRNLFAPAVSGSPLAQESEITRTVEADQIWIGEFTFFNHQGNSIKTYMAVSTISDQHRVCCCLPKNIEQPDANPQLTEPAVFSQPAPVITTLPTQLNSANSARYATKLAVLKPAEKKLSDQEDTALPIFNQQNTLAALQAPNLVLTEPERLKRWYMVMHSAWCHHHSEPLPIIISCDEIDELLLARMLALLPNDAKRQIWLLVMPDELDYFQALGCNIMLQLGYEQDNETGTWTVGELQNGLKAYTSIIHGLCLLPHQFNYLKKDTQQGCKTLKKLQLSGLFIWASDTHSTEALACAHSCDVNWMSGDALSKPISSAQLGWYAP